MKMPWSFVVPWSLIVFMGIGLSVSHFRCFRQRYAVIHELPLQDRQVAIRAVDALAQKMEEVSPQAASILLTLEGAMIAEIEEALADQVAVFSESEVRRLQELLGKPEQKP